MTCFRLVCMYIFMYMYIHPYLRTIASSIFPIRCASLLYGVLYVSKMLFCNSERKSYTIRPNWNLFVDWTIWWKRSKAYMSRARNEFCCIGWYIYTHTTTTTQKGEKNRECEPGVKEGREKSECWYNIFCLVIKERSQKSIWCLHFTWYNRNTKLYSFFLFEGFKKIFQYYVCILHTEWHSGKILYIPNL